MLGNQNPSREIKKRSVETYFPEVLNEEMRALPWRSAESVPYKLNGLGENRKRNRRSLHYAALRSR